MADYRNRSISLVQGTRKYQPLASASAVGLLIIAGIYILGTSKNIPLEYLTGDPAMINHTPLYFGVLSNLGVMLWAAAATCAFLGAGLLQKDLRKFRFLLFSGLFSTFLGVDDLLSIHEHILPHTLHIPEKIGYFGYLLLAGIFFVSYITIILRETDYIILAVALLFFGLSIVTIFIPFIDRAFVKDNLKFLGIVYWLVYFFYTTLRFARIRLTLSLETEN